MFFFWFGGAWAIPKVCAPRCSATYECPTELAAVSVPALGVSQRRCLPWWHPTMLVTCRRSHSACFRMWTRSTLGRDQLGPDLVKTMQRMVSFQSGTSELTPWIFLEWQWAKQPIGQAFSNNADNAPIHTVVKFPVSDSHGVSSPCRSKLWTVKATIFPAAPSPYPLGDLEERLNLGSGNSPSSPNSQGFENSRSRDLLEEWRGGP